MRLHQLGVTSINDLSDNGKKFEFGYDSENDTYGYYKNGVFTGFGGGGVSTKCIIKGGIFFPWYQGSTSWIATFDTDGSYTYTYIPRYAEIQTTLKTECEKLSFIKSFSSVNGSGYGPQSATFTIEGGGYFVWVTKYDIYTMNPTYVQDGGEITTGSTITNSFECFLYCGVELPS